MGKQVEAGIIKEATERANKGVMEDAPYWYGTHIDKLDFEWSREDKLEIERYCEKIHRNIAGDEMTPYQRYRALIKGEPKDRQFVFLMGSTVTATQVYNWTGDLIKPVDLFRNPKLWVKVLLYVQARLGADTFFGHSLSYGEEIWGGRGKMIEYGQPCSVKNVIKTMEDVEALQVPDPRQDGIYPGFLWSLREVRRIFDEYELTGVVPILGSVCPGLDTMVMMSMMGWGPYLIALRKNPELCQRATEVALEWNKRYFEAEITECKPDWIQMCEFTGAYDIKPYTWLADYLLELAKYVKGLSPETHIHFGTASYDKYFDWMDVMQEHGGVGPDTFDGGLTGNEPWDKLKKMIDYHREHKLYYTASLPDEIMSKGSISDIEEAVKELCDYSKSNLKYAPSAYSDFWAPTANLEAFIIALKKYGKY